MKLFGSWSVEKQLLILLIFSLLTITPPLWATRNFSFRLDTDYDSNLPIYYSLVNHFRVNGYFPKTHEFAADMPVIGDPLAAVFQPMFFLPVLVFGVDTGVRVSIVLSGLVSAFTMWGLLGSLGVKHFQRVWGSLLYQVAGAWGAKIAAGHIEKVLSYPLFPLFFLFALKKEKPLLHIAASAFVLTLVFFGGDVYGVFHLLLFSCFICMFWIWKAGDWRNQFASLGAMVGIFVFFSLPKLLPFMLDVIPQFARYHAIDPMEGSIHAFLVPLSYVVPFQVNFYDRPFFQRLFQFRFNWYEYYAFISPLPFLFLVKIRKALKDDTAQLIVFLLLIGSLFAAVRYPYSPFHWLVQAIPFIQNFRVPQRIVVPMTSLVLALLSVCLQKIVQPKKNALRNVLLTVSLISYIWTAAISIDTVKKAFEPTGANEQLVARQLRQLDSGNYSVAVFTCCMQTFLVQEDIGIVDYYYGWRMKNAPSVHTGSGDVDFTALEQIRPRYIIAKRERQFDRNAYSRFFDSGDIQVWKLQHSDNL